MKQNAAARICVLLKPKKKDLDEVNVFYLSIAITVKRLSKIHQIRIRMKLCKLVSQVKIDTMEHTFPSYNSYHTSVITSQNSSQSIFGSTYIIYIGALLCHKIHQRILFNSHVQNATGLNAAVLSRDILEDFKNKL